jgi:hypothetical protein
LEKLAHNLRLRRFIEDGIISIFKQWKKLTAATSFDQELQKLSHRTAAEYALKHFDNSIYFQSKSKLYQFMKSEVLKATDPHLIHAEFGVFKGQSINYFANSKTESRRYGFD